MCLSVENPDELADARPEPSLFSDWVKDIHYRQMGRNLKKYIPILYQKLHTAVTNELKRRRET